MDKLRIKIRREMVPLVQAYARIDKVVLDDLETSFDEELYTKGDPYDTAFHLGEREVVKRIQRMISYSGCEVEEEENANA